MELFCVRLCVPVKELASDFALLIFDDNLNITKNALLLFEAIGLNLCSQHIQQPIASSFSALLHSIREEETTY